MSSSVREDFLFPWRKKLDPRASTLIWLKPGGNRKEGRIGSIAQDLANLTGHPMSTFGDGSPYIPSDNAIPHHHIRRDQ